MPIYQYGNGSGEHNVQGVDIRPGQLLHLGQPALLATPHRGVASEVCQCAGAECVCERVGWDVVRWCCGSGVRCSEVVGEGWGVVRWCCGSGLRCMRWCCERGGV